MKNETIRFGIIGAAGRGNSFVRSLQANPAASVTALCDLREQEIRERAAELEVEGVFTDAETMLESGQVDAVVIGTPDHTHAPPAAMAMYCTPSCM